MPSRLRAAFETTNRNPLGACAITGTGFPIDRELHERAARLRRADRQHLRQHRDRGLPARKRVGRGGALTGLGRFVQDLLLWCTAEFGYLRLGDGFVQCSSIMPQKRNPVALEHARAIGSKALGQAQAIAPPSTTRRSATSSTPRTICSRSCRRCSATRRAPCGWSPRRCRRPSSTRRGSRRAPGEGGTTLTELADTLVREHGLPFQTAHAIAGALLKARAARPGARRCRALAARPPRCSARRSRTREGGCTRSSARGIS